MMLVKPLSHEIVQEEKLLLLETSKNVLWQRSVKVYILFCIIKDKFSIMRDKCMSKNDARGN